MTVFSAAAMPATPQSRSARLTSKAVLATTPISHRRLPVRSTDNRPYRGESLRQRLHERPLARPIERPFEIPLESPPESPPESKGVTNSDQAEQLLNRIADGDDEALRDLYRLYGRLAFSLAIRILANQEQAEDAVQEAFLRVWRNANRFDPARGAFSTWFGRMVRNLCIDVLRRRDPLSRAGPLDDVDRWTRASEPTDNAVLDRIIIREAFLRLPGDQARVLDMAYFQGLTHREIAGVLSIPEGTVKSRMRLGLQKMRSHLLEGSAP